MPAKSKKRKAKDAPPADASARANGSTDSGGRGGGGGAASEQRARRRVRLNEEIRSAPPPEDMIESYMQSCKRQESITQQLSVLRSEATSLSASNASIRQKIQFDQKYIESVLHLAINFAHRSTPSAGSGGSRRGSGGDGVWFVQEILSLIAEYAVRLNPSVSTLSTKGMESPFHVFTRHCENEEQVVVISAWHMARTFSFTSTCANTV